MQSSTDDDIERSGTTTSARHATGDVSARASALAAVQRACSAPEMSPGSQYACAQTAHTGSVRDERCAVCAGRRRTASSRTMTSPATPARAILVVSGAAHGQMVGVRAPLSDWHGRRRRRQRGGTQGQGGMRLVWGVSVRGSCVCMCVCVCVQLTTACASYIFSANVSPS